MIRIHPTRTQGLGVTGDALMKALGLTLEKLIDLSKARDASVRGNDIFLDPNRILPPPAIEGHGNGGSPACAGCSAPSALIRTYQTSHGRLIVTMGMPYPDALRSGPRDVATREVRQPGRATHELLHPSSARNRRTRAQPRETVLA